MATINDIVKNQNSLSSQQKPKNKLPKIFYGNDKVIYYYDVNGKTEYMVDFNSPRTLKASTQIGVSFEDCVIK